jgi:hypothetical protein
LGLLFLYRFLIGRVLLLVAGFFHYFHWLAVETLCLLTRFLYLMFLFYWALLALMNLVGLFFLVFLIVLLICLLILSLFAVKKGFKVKVTGHVKGIGDDATMEDNTPQQLAIDLKYFLPEGEQPRKVSTIGCSSDVCDKGHYIVFAICLLQSGRETVGGFCNDVVCAYFINHYAAIFFVGHLIAWFD